MKKIVVMKCMECEKEFQGLRGQNCPCGCNRIIILHEKGIATNNA